VQGAEPMRSPGYLPSPRDPLAVARQLVRDNYTEPVSGGRSWLIASARADLTFPRRSQNPAEGRSRGSRDATKVPEIPQSRRPDSNRGPLHYEAWACVGGRRSDVGICRQDGRFRVVVAVTAGRVSRDHASIRLPSDMRPLGRSASELTMSWLPSKWTPVDDMQRSDALVASRHVLVDPRA
jgi:hypothetical protein